MIAQNSLPSQKKPEKKSRQRKEPREYRPYDTGSKVQDSLTVTTTCAGEVVV